MAGITVVPDKRAVVLPAGYASPEVLSHTTRHQEVNGSRVVVSHDLESCAVLAAAGRPVPHPIRYYYDFPGPWKKPMAHQVTTAAFLTLNPRAFVFNEIGTAKTASTLWALDYLWREEALDGPVLIISPLSTLRRVWQDEVRKLFGVRYRVNILHGSKAKRLDLLRQPADFYVINHDGIKVIADELAADARFRLVIVDEGAEFRNRQTDRWRALARICGVETARGVWWLTGSPTPNSPLDAYAQAKLVAPGRAPRYYTRYRDDVMYQINQYLWHPREGWQEYVKDMLQPSVRFTRDKCIDLPPVVTETREVEMTPEQARVYKQMRETLIAEVKGGEITAFNEGVKLIKLAQIACGVVYDRKGEEHQIKPTTKLSALHEVIHESGNKLIIFVPYRHTIHMLAKELEEWKLSFGVVYGDTSARERDQYFNAFQHGDLQVLLAHPETMAHGLTLTATATICWFGPISSYAVYEQAIGRISRPGQTRKQTIIHLTASEVEKRIYARLQKKEKMQGLLLTLLER